MAKKKDIVTLNVSGTIMVTKQSTLCIVEDSVLAQQFDDSEWTEQGCNNLCVKEWSSEDVTSWVHKIDGIPNEVSNTFKENKITGLELLTLKQKGLMMLGITRIITLCLLLSNIEMLEKASQDLPASLGTVPITLVKYRITLERSRFILKGL